MPEDGPTDAMDVSGPPPPAAGRAPKPAVPPAVKAFAQAAPTRAARKLVLRTVRREKAGCAPLVLVRLLLEAAGASGLAGAHAAPFLAQLGAHASATRPVLVAASRDAWQLVTAPGAAPRTPGALCLYWYDAWRDCAPRLCAPTRTAALPLALVQLAPLLGRAAGRPLLAPPRVAPATPAADGGVAGLAGTLLHEPRLLPAALARGAPPALQSAHAHQAFWSLDHRGGALLVYPPGPDADGYAYYSDASTPFAWQRVDPELGRFQLAAWAAPDAPAAQREIVPCTASRAAAIRAACAQHAAPGFAVQPVARLLAFVRALERATAGEAGAPAYVQPDVAPLAGPLDWGAAGHGDAPPVAVRQFLVRVLLPDEPFWLQTDLGPGAPPHYDWVLTTRGVYWRALAPGEADTPASALAALDGARWRVYDGGVGRVPGAHGRYTPALVAAQRPRDGEALLLTRAQLHAHVQALLAPPGGRAPSVLRAAGVVHRAVRAALAQLAALLWPDCAADLGAALAPADATAEGAADEGRDALALAGQLAGVPAAWWRTLAGTPDPAQPLAGVPPAVLLAFLTVVRERHVLGPRGGDAGWTWGWADTPRGAVADSGERDESVDEEEDEEEDEEGHLPRSLRGLARAWPRPAWSDARLALLAGRGSLGPLLVRLDLRGPGSTTVCRLWQWAWAAREWQPLSERAVAWRLAADRTLASLTVPARLADVLALADKGAAA